MSMVTYPLNGIEYAAEDAELFHSTRTSGVYATNSFDCSVTGSDNTVVIGTGIAWIKNREFSGKVVAQKESVSLDMGVSDPIYPRIDAVVIQFDANKNASEIVVKNGTASSNPVAPSVVRTEVVYELHLYHVRRDAGSLSISSGAITDLRPNDNYCGLMSDSVTQSVDATLSKTGVAADAGAVGTALAGKAPAGFGLGGSKWLNSKKDADGNEIGGWNLALQSGFYSSGFNCPPKGTSNYMGIVTTFSPGTGIQIVWQAYPPAGKNDVFMRLFINNEFRKWEEWSPSAFAPAGYGYGGEIPDLIEADSDAALKTALDGLLANMPNFSARNVRVAYNGASIVNGAGTMGSQGTLYGSLYKHGANYAILRVFGYLGTSFSLVKLDTWGEVEWVNPAMAGSVEYRTTERFGGKPVYVCLRDSGSLPNAGTKTIAHTIENISAVLSIHGTATDGRTIPYKNGNESIEVAADKTNVYVTTTTNMTAQKGTFCMKYVKTTD